MSQVCWLTLVIPALGKLRQEDLEFKTSLDYIVRTWLKAGRGPNLHFESMTLYYSTENKLEEVG
jgi:hypothetical protein